MKNFIASEEMGRKLFSHEKNVIYGDEIILGGEKRKINVLRSNIFYVKNTNRKNNKTTTARALSYEKFFKINI